MKNKKLIVGIIVFIFFMIGTYVVYNWITNNDNKKKTELNSSPEGSSIESKSGEIEVSRYKATDFKIYDEDGNEVSLKDFQGKPAIINVFASWCGPCEEEMPLFQSLYDNYNNEEIMVLMVNLTDGHRETQESATKFMSESGYSMPIYFDKDLDLVEKYNVMSIPRTIFIDRDGYIIEDYNGKIDASILHDYLKILLN